MLDWIKSWFGKGKIRVEFKGINREGKIVSGDGKMPYIGKWDEAAAIEQFKEQAMYKYGVVITELNIVAHIED